MEIERFRVSAMTDLPEGWDEYDPDNHDRSGDAEYEQARAAVAEVRRKVGQRG